MSGDKESRMLGAGDTIDVTEHYSNGKSKKKTYTLRPVRVRELLELEREALKSYKKEYLTTFKENSVVFDGDKDKILRDEVARVGKWSLADLPQRDAFSLDSIEVSDKLINWTIETCGIDFSEEQGESGESESGESEKASKATSTLISEIAIRALLITSLDNGGISSQEVYDLTGKRPLRGKVRYDQWWVTGTIDGMVAYVEQSAKFLHPEVNFDHIINTWPYHKIVEASRVVDRLTTASVGNG